MQSHSLVLTIFRLNMNVRMLFLSDLIKEVYLNKRLILSLTKRDIASKYKGSLIGLLWTFIYPVLMLAVYTFVFSVVFKARWPGGSDSKTEFALILFSGLMIFNIFSECISRAPSLIIGNVNYVKKVVFPLSILPIVSLLSSLFHFVMAMIVWVVFYLIFFGMPKVEILLLPLAILPMLLIVLGSSYFLCALGVYIRDIIQFIGVFVTMLMFLSPLFYPVSALPESFQSLMHLNPLTYAIETTRDLLIFGRQMEWGGWGRKVLYSTLALVLGYAFFAKTKRGFADVL